MIEWSREKLLETSGFYWRSLVLQTAVKLDVFTVVGSGCVTAGKIAEAIDGDERGVTMLLNALAALGLLNKLDGGFANTDASAVCLAKDSASYIGHLILHHHHLVGPWLHLDEAVRSGEPVRADAARDDEGWRASFLLGMHNQARAVAPLVAESVDLSGRRHLLDLGGGPGTYAIHFCQRNADLRATIYDLPTTRPFAEGIVAEYDMSKRIDFVGGDFTADEIKGRYDAAWLSHILHGESAEQ